MFLPLYVWEGDDLDGISALQIFKHFFCQNFILKNVNLPNLLLPEFLPLQQNCLWVRVCMFYISCLIILIEMFSFDKKISFLEVLIHYSLNVFLCSLCVESLLSSLTWGTDHKISFTFWTFVTFTWKNTLKGMTYFHAHIHWYMVGFYKFVITCLFT